MTFKDPQHSKRRLTLTAYLKPQVFKTVIEELGFICQFHILKKVYRYKIFNHNKKFK